MRKAARGNGSSKARAKRLIRALPTAARCCARRYANILCTEAMHGLGIRHHAGAGAHRQPRCGVSRGAGNRRDRYPHCAELYPLRPFRISLSHRPSRAAGTAGRFSDCAPFTPNAARPKTLISALFQEIARRSAELVAAWQSVGFCHGVLNTDNMSALGLTIDYGPFGFLDAYDRRHVPNHSDTAGRYAYNEQPYVVHWNSVAAGFLPAAAGVRQRLDSTNWSAFPSFFRRPI